MIVHNTPRADALEMAAKGECRILSHFVKDGERLCDVEVPDKAEGQAATVADEAPRKRARKKAAE